MATSELDSEVEFKRRALQLGLGHSANMPSVSLISQAAPTRAHWSIS